MSAPSGKPFDPFDLSPYAPRRARERVAPDQPAFGNSAVENRSAAENRNDDSERATADPLPYAPSATQRSNAAGERPADPDSGEPAHSRPQTEPLDRPIPALSNKISGGRGCAIRCGASSVRSRNAYASFWGSSSLKLPQDSGSQLKGGH